MLLRLTNHYVLNPHLIDKLIVIKGLPYEWIFKKAKEGDELLPPWEPDVEANIPESIRHLCEPITYCKWFPPIRHYDRTHEGFWDTRTVLGLRLDFGYGPAQEMWIRVQDYIQGTIPRTEKMPVPVLAAPDQKSAFAIHGAKQSERGGGIVLFPTQIPIVDLTIYNKTQTVAVPAIPVIAVSPVIPVSTTTTPEVKFTPKGTTSENGKCELCSFETINPRAMKIHLGRKHPFRNAPKQEVAV